MENKGLAINEDNKKYLLKTIKDLIQTSAFLRDFIEKNNLTEDMENALPSLIESHTIDILKALGYESSLEKKQVERNAQIKSLYKENRGLMVKLEDCASNAFDPALIVNSISKIERTLKDRWDNRKTGLDGLVKLKIEGHYAYIEFIPMFMSHCHSSATPDTCEKEFKIFIDSVKDKGYVFAEDKIELLFNDINNKLICEFISSIVPGINIQEIKNINYGGVYKINGVVAGMPLSELINVTR